jgi:hypothetical protein
MKNEVRIEGDFCFIRLRRGGRKGTQFVETVINACDYDRVNDFRGTWTPKWNPTAQTFYARANDPDVGYMHRWIIGAVSKKVKIDHDDHNGLNNRRINLHATCVKGNGFNRRGAERGSKSGCRNVYWNQREQKWMVWVVCMGKRYYVGYFTDVDAADKAAKELRISLGGKA